jgi:hypothetical protein
MGGTVSACLWTWLMAAKRYSSFMVDPKDSVLANTQPVILISGG